MDVGSKDQTKKISVEHVSFSRLKQLQNMMFKKLEVVMVANGDVDSLISERREVTLSPSHRPFVFSTDPCQAHVTANTMAKKLHSPSCCFGGLCAAK